ncbi:MAG: hypothetical protein DSM106950_00310 [Stigonema ocellatum SAG 48.90 = DSM 106950]|nr:hypothetical protein [Stigonema ocellatum SAG 48.90 = DSM 106950]
MNFIEAIAIALNWGSVRVGITNVRLQDIRRAIAEERPEIVHFCGHEQEDGSLVLEDDGGNHKPVSSLWLKFGDSEAQIA